MIPAVSTAKVEVFLATFFQGYLSGSADVFPCAVWASIEFGRNPELARSYTRKLSIQGDHVAQSNFLRKFS